LCKNIQIEFFLPMEHTTVLHFWFEEADPRQWWKADPDFDRLITRRFGALHAEAAHSGLPLWRDGAPGRLAEIIVLDQFSRNIHRGTPAAFACDAQALELAQQATELGLAASLPPVQRAFLYLPYMHSEDAAVHERAMVLFSEPGLEPNLAAEVKHKVIIDRFGRYPHRNAILGRQSTPEEDAFLKLPGSSF
jgi:uncharacterized protein (DUF924 family)